jgi:hypothetical protein
LDFYFENPVGFITLQWSGLNPYAPHGNKGGNSLPGVVRVVVLGSCLCGQGVSGLLDFVNPKIGVLHCLFFNHFRRCGC